MQLKKTDRPIRSDDEVVAAIVTPHPDQTDAQVASFLHARGAEEVITLAPGFLSVRSSLGVLKQAESVAVVELKAPKQMR